VILHAQTRSLESLDIDEISELPPRQQGAQLVGHDLAGRIDPDAADLDLFCVDLGRGVAYEIHDDGFSASLDQETPEVRRGSQFFDARSKISSGIEKPRLTLFQKIVRREKVEIQGRTMVEMETNQGSASGEKEALLPFEKGYEDLLLKAIEPSQC
jgi:hypothetical protein